MKEFIEPVFLMEGDQRLKINGKVPAVDCRVISEDQYLLLKSAYDAMIALKKANNNFDTFFERIN